MDIRTNFIKCKNWVKDHKREVIGGLAIAAAGIGAVMIGKSISKRSNDEVQLLDTTDYGRDCTMKFIVNDTQEVLGEVPCTELFVKETLEM